MPASDPITKDNSGSRQRRIALTLVGLVLVSIAVAAVLVVQPASAEKPPVDFYGVVPQEELDSRDFSHMQSDRVGMVRQTFFWPAIEPYEGQYDWAATDEVMRQASAAGIEIFPVLYGLPAWAQSEKQLRRCVQACAPSTSAAREAFARFAAAAVARYGPNGSFWTDPPVDPGTDRPIEAWQVWNEPNSPKYYAPKVDVRGYAALVEETSRAIHGVDARADVVLGGMWGPPGVDAVMPTLDYLERVYRLRGTRKHFDSIAVHPYAGRFASVKAQIRGTRELVKRMGDSNVGIWVTELGWASDGPKREPLVKSRRQQALLLSRSFRFLIRKRVPWRIRSVHWYSLRDTGRGAGICAWCPRSGLRTSAGAAKPAATAYRNLPRADR